MEKYLIVIQKSAHNYGAYSPDVPGCVATGATVEETISNMRQALEFHLKGLAEDGEPMPESKGLAHHLAQNEPIAEANDLLTYVEVRLPEIALIFQINPPLPPAPPKTPPPSPQTTPSFSPRWF